MVESKIQYSSRLNQKGQGMVEYLLLLFITVTMILLAMANLFKPMQNFLQNFMGTYVACLLTSGELPAIRVENTMKDTESKCSFSLTGGKATAGNGTLGSNGGNGNNGSNGNGTNSNGNTSANGSNPDGASGDGSSVNGGGGGNSYAGSRSRRGAFGKSSFLKRSSDGGSGGANDDAGGGGTRYVSNLNSKDDRFFKVRQKTTQLSSKNGRGIYVTGMTEDEKKKIERKIQSSPRSVPKSSEEFSVPGRKSIVKPPPEARKKVLAQDEESFTLGNFFKYVLIAVVLLLILILGGGQAFEMSKTME
tara:strand:+ start:177498 stop:178412 length:915 start_codon:yes stop_codon:yes gene_type:complete